jgi:YesN/AraC family two-component response regulator
MDCDFVTAYKHANKAIKIKNNYPEGQQFLSFLYTLKGDMKNALKHLSLALDLDPLNHETLFYKAFFNYRNGDYQNSITILDELLNTNSKNIPAFTVKAYNLLCLGETKCALQLLNELPEEVVIIDDKLGIECLARIIDGEIEKSNNLLSILEENAKSLTAIQAHSYLFLSYINLNRFDDAFHLLEKSLSNQSPIFLISYSDPLAKKLRNDIRYYQFEKQIYPDISSVRVVENSKPDLIDEVTSRIIIKKLEEFIEQESPYLNPDLSLRLLAELIEIHPNQLSWLLNKKINKNFNEFINHYRVSHFKTLALDTSNSHISLIGLAYESGFNSKTTFNTYFKKETGFTPSEFIKSQK